jgi:hypothetical protein
VAAEVATEEEEEEEVEMDNPQGWTKSAIHERVRTLRSRATPVKRERKYSRPNTLLLGGGLQPIHMSNYAVHRKRLRNLTGKSNGTGQSTVPAVQTCLFNTVTLPTNTVGMLSKQRCFNSFGLLGSN